MHILELRKIGCELHFWGPQENPTRAGWEWVSLWEAISHGHLFPGKCQNGANCKTRKRRCDRELGMCSLERSMFCEDRSIVFKHAHNVRMAPKEQHQAHVL